MRDEEGQIESPMTTAFMTDAEVLGLDVAHLDAILDGRVRAHEGAALDARVVIRDSQELGEELSEETVANGVLMGTRPDSPQEALSIAEQLQCCLMALSSARIESWADCAMLESAAQKRLSDLLMRYPVLMHPALLSVYRQGSTTVLLKPLSFQVVGARMGRLPSRDDGYTDDALRAWISHPCVVAGLSTRATEDSFIELQCQGRRALEDACVRGGCSARMLVSLHELHELRDGGVDAEALFGEMGLQNSRNLISRLCDMLMAACDDGRGESLRWLDLMRTTYSARLPELREDMPYHLAHSVAYSLFDDSTITARMGRYTAGLVRAGVYADEAAVAQVLLSFLATKYVQPLDQVELAMELFRALKTYGVAPSEETLMPAGMAAGHGQAQSWSRALEIVRAEETMNAVLGAPALSSGDRKTTTSRGRAV